MRDMLDNIADLAFTHAEKELGLQPARKLEREKQSLFPGIDETIDEYSRERAFWLTGIERTEILLKTKGYLLEWAKSERNELVIEDGIREVLASWLPERDRAGRIINVAHRTEVVVRTNLSDMYNYSRWMHFQQPALQNFMEGYQYSAIMDGRTTPVCRYLHGKMISKEESSEYNPPNHFNCRSILIPITITQQLDFDTELEKRGDLSLAESHLPQKGFRTRAIK